MTIEELFAKMTKVSKQPIPSLVAAQIDKFHNNDGMEYSEIYDCFEYYYVVVRKGDAWDNYLKYGIGIVPKIRLDAKLYYRKRNEERIAKQLAAERIKNNDVEIVNFKPQRRSFHRREIDLDDIE